MKLTVSTDTRRQVLELRRRHSLRAVAEQTGLPLGTVKTIYPANRGPCRFSARCYSDGAETAAAPVLVRYAPTVRP